MSKDNSHIISELAELYELSLGIGTSLDLAKNATTFFSSVAQRKNFQYISVWQHTWRHEKEAFLLKEAFPRIQENETIINKESTLYTHLSNLKKEQVHLIEKAKVPYSEFDASNIWVYNYQDLLILFIQNHQDETLENREKSQLSSLFKKFSVSIKASISHKALLDEVLKREKAEYKLFERESLFRFGANSLSEGIVVTDLNSRITYVNKAMTAITGFSKKEMTGAISYKLFQPIGFTDELRNRVYKNIIQDKSEVYEFQQIKKDGLHYWVRITISALKNTTNTIVGSIATVLDITQEINTQRAIEKSQMDLQNLLDNMYDGLLVLDENGVIMNANNSCMDLFELVPDDLGKAFLKDFVHPDNKSDVSINRDVVKEQGSLSSITSKILTKSGKIKVVEVSSSAIVEKGVYKGSRDIVRDITESVIAREELEASKSELEDLIENMYDALIVVGSGGNVERVNKAGEELLGYSKKEISEFSFNKLVHPDDLEKSQNYLKKLKTEGYYSGYEGRIISGDGTIKTVEVNSTAIFDNGNLIGSRDIIRDITERKEIEFQKEVLLAELEVVNQELRDFAYIVSHDLKAPLRSIGSLSDWLIQDYQEALDDEGRELLRLLKTRIGRMHNLIEGVLQYSKVGRLQDEKEEVDINLLLEETIDSLDPPNTCIVHFEKNMPTVRYDKIRLQQVFQNLISNAIKFLDKPKGEIIISLSHDNTHYHFAIEDNGPGIEENYFNKIFQIFQTLTSKDEYESTGIGLSIVKRIVELNGGTISVKSTVGVGSTFSFTIPKNK
ncbi:MAG: hypothetical protein COA58_10690 [Bacteroidetes bacterium]|nr:MAG: hypothetical protein COA58_10690 [Bacteroidota bacterium]